MAHYVLTALALCYIRLTCKCSSIDHPNSHITQFDMHVISWGLKLICPPHRKLKECFKEKQSCIYSYNSQFVYIFWPGMYFSVLRSIYIRKLKVYSVWVCINSCSVRLNEHVYVLMEATRCDNFRSDAYIFFLRNISVTIKSLFIFIFWTVSDVFIYFKQFNGSRWNLDTIESFSVTNISFTYSSELSRKKSWLASHCLSH